MRASSRSRILEAAIRIINRDGVAAVTYESVAAEAELTRGGILYHFPSRDALIVAINAHLAERWEASMAEAAGRPPLQLSAHERQLAYVRAGAEPASRSELTFMLETSDSEEGLAPWTAALSRWAAPIPGKETDDAAIDAFIARMATDGLWVFEAMGNGQLTARMRARLVRRIVELLGEGPGTATPARPAARKS